MCSRSFVIPITIAESWRQCKRTEAIDVLVVREAKYYSTALRALSRFSLISTWMKFIESRLKQSEIIHNSFKISMFSQKINNLSFWTSTWYAVLSWITSQSWKNIRYPELFPEPRCWPVRSRYNREGRQQKPCRPKNYWLKPFPAFSLQNYYRSQILTPWHDLTSSDW